MPLHQAHPSADLDEYDVVAAASAISEFVLTTPVIRSHVLSDLTGCEIFLKLESMQRTGSFKVRGAFNRMLGLSREDRARGVVTCSSGNHGRAVAYAGQRLGIPATICVPEWVDRVKLQAIRDAGATPVVHGRSYDDAERHSYELQRAQNLAYVHPFDDPAVIAGQGTVGLELLAQIPDLDTVVVPLSGGGLAAGIGLAMLHAAPAARVVGASAERARVMVESVRAGHPISMAEEETVATALAGGIGMTNQHTLSLVHDLVEELVLVPERSIIDGIALAAQRHHLVVEGGGATGIGAVLSGRVQGLGDRIAIVVSGGNIELDSWIRLVAAAAV